MDSGSDPGGEDRVRKKIRASFFSACGRGENPVVVGMTLTARDVTHFGRIIKSTTINLASYLGLPNSPTLSIVSPCI